MQPYLLRHIHTPVNRNLRHFKQLMPDAALNAKQHAHLLPHLLRHITMPVINL
jgi:hypothetical protein